MLENIKNVKDLQSVVLAINVKDFGDFKRKIVLYLNRFNEEQALSADQKKVITDIIEKVQFNYSSDIEKARRWTIDQLGRLH